MAPLQRRVYWILCVNFFCTALMFFVDVFTVHASSCGLTQNQSSLSQQSPDTAHLPSHNSTCMGTESYTYGQTMYMIGLLIGSLTGGILSDKYGKKALLVGCSILQALTALVCAFLPYTIFYLAARCVGGITCCGINISAFSLGVEWSSPKYRMWPPALLTFSFSLGMMSLAAVAYLSSSWMQLHLAIAAPQILCLPLYFYTPESPQWLFVNRRLELLEKYRKRSPQDKHCLDMLLNTDETGIHQATTQWRDSEKHSVFHNFRSPTIILRLFIMSFIGMTSAMTYYGICFNVGHFGVNIYLAQFFSGMSESPCLLVPFLLARCGRRPFSAVSLLMSGIACLLSLVVSRFSGVPALVMTFALLGKFCIQTTVFVSLLYGIELFPTVIRQKCVGLVSLWYRIGSILTALVTPVDGIPLAAMLCYGSGPILGAVLCLLLPETSGRPLPDTVQDCETQPRLSICSRRGKMHVQEDILATQENHEEQQITLPRRESV